MNSTKREAKSGDAVDSALNSARAHAREWLCENYSDPIYCTAHSIRKKALSNPEWIPAAGRERGTRTAREWPVQTQPPLGSNATPGARRTRIRIPTITICIIPVSIRVASISSYREARPLRRTLPPITRPLSSLICSCKVPSRRLWTNSSSFTLLEDRAGPGEPYLMTGQVSDSRATLQFWQYRSIL